VKINITIDKLGVVVPVINQFQKAIKAIESVKARCHKDIYIIDQWRTRRPLARAWNEGVLSAINDGCNYILVINDDVLFAPYTVDALIDAFKEDEKIVMTTGSNQRKQLSDPEDIFSLMPPSSCEIADHPDFSCFLIKDDFFTKVGLFDENFDPSYFEDNDCHHRIKLLGYRAISTPLAPYYHYGSSSQNAHHGEPLCAPQQFEACRAYFKRKWGNNPDAENLWRYPYNNDGFSPKKWIPGA
jgi:hypothetical protein